MNTKKTLVTFIILVCAFFASSSEASLTRSQRVADAKAMLALFDHRYAPIQWKKDYMGIDMHSLAQNLLAEVDREEMADQDFYAAMLRFSGALKDTHNWFIIPSSLHSKLGFVADYLEGEVLIEDIDRKILPADKFPFERGDRLISIDDISVEETLKNLSQYEGHGNEISQMRFQTRYLTNRHGSWMPYVPTGLAKLKIFSQTRRTIEIITIPWITTGLPIAEMGQGPALLSSIKNTIVDIFTDNGKPSGRSFLDTFRWMSLDQSKIEATRIGDQTPFFPMWKSFVKRTDKPLLSGIFMLENRRIGFIRIPTWVASPKEWIAFLEREIPYLDEETDALVIDQTNNGGGFGCLSASVSEFFITQATSSVLFQIRANRHFLSMLESDLEYCSTSNDPDCKLVEEIIQEMRRSIAAGDLLTIPLPLCSQGYTLKPHATKEGKTTVYRKPILMLVNDWSISAADLTPAQLQDSGNVVIFGSRTCGAGGNVETIGSLGYSDFAISQTESLMYRPKGVKSPNSITTHYIENVGVIPDIEYQISKDDFMSGYQGYKKAIEQSILGLIDNQTH